MPGRRFLPSGRFANCVHARDGRRSCFLFTNSTWLINARRREVFIHHTHIYVSRTGNGADCPISSALSEQMWTRENEHIAINSLNRTYIDFVFWLLSRDEWKFNWCYCFWSRENECIFCTFARLLYICHPTMFCRKQQHSESDEARRIYRALCTRTVPIRGNHVLSEHGNKVHFKNHQKQNIHGCTQVEPARVRIHILHLRPCHVHNQCHQHQYNGALTESE